MIDFIHFCPAEQWDVAQKVLLGDERLLLSCIVER